MQKFQAINLTVSGFTARLKLTGIATSITNETDGESGGGAENDWGSGHGSPDYRCGKENTSEAWDDRYTFNYNVTVPRAYAPSEFEFYVAAVHIDFHTYNGTSWILRGSTVHYNSDTGSSLTLSNQSYTIILDGLDTEVDGAGDTFGAHYSAGDPGGYGGASFTMISTTWARATGVPTEVSATGSGIPKVPFTIIGNVGGF